MNPRVSVVVVSYRSRETIAGCLESLRACAEVVPLQVVVVDNASGDGTAELVRAAYPGVELIANPDNRGFTRAVNQGLERGRGDYLFVLNPDCLVGPSALERLVTTLDDEPDLGAAAPMLLDADRRPVRSCGRFPDLWTLFCDHFGLAGRFAGSAWLDGYKYGGRALESLERVDWASGAALLLTRRAYAAVGGLDENIFMYMEEVDWCRRAAAADFAVRYVPAARVVHFGQASSRQAAGESYRHNLRSRVYYFRKHHGWRSASVAKGILLASLLAKWCASAMLRAGRAEPRFYAVGLETVWAA